MDRSFTDAVGVAWQARNPVNGVNPTYRWREGSNDAFFGYGNSDITHYHVFFSRDEGQPWYQVKCNNVRGQIYNAPEVYRGAFNNSYNANAWAQFFENGLRQCMNNQLVLIGGKKSKRSLKNRSKRSATHRKKKHATRRR
jgi:hypothetical protein